jgi:hypothetical protein
MMKRSRVLLPNAIRLRPSSYTSFIFLFLLLQLVSGKQQQQQQQQQHQQQPSSLCCHVVAFAAEELADDGTWTFAATMSSPYETGPEKYCDFFEVRTLPVSEGGNYTVLAKRVFLHHHPTEQPFIRRVHHVVLPDDVDTVVGVAHDLIDGFCGDKLTLALDGSEPTSVTAPKPTSVKASTTTPLPTPFPTGAPVEAVAPATASTPDLTNAVPTALLAKPSNDSGAYRSVSITVALVVAAFFLGYCCRMKGLRRDDRMKVNENVEEFELMNVDENVEDVELVIT